MKYKFKLMFIVATVMCLILAASAPADNVVKTLYVDGSQIGQTTDPNAGLQFSFSRLTIGTEGNRWYMYNAYTGSMDEFAVYDGVMSLSRVQAHYNAIAVSNNYTTYQSEVNTDAPLLWLKFDDANLANGASAANSGSAGGGVVPSYIVTADTEVFSQTTGIATGSNALVFPTVDDGNGLGACVDVYDGGELGSDLTEEGDVSIEFWCKFTGEVTEYPRFFQHNGSWDVVESYGMTVPNDPCQLVALGGESSTYFDMASPINDNAWHHVVITYDSYYEPNVTPTLTYAQEVAADNPLIWVRFEDEEPVDSAGGDDWVGYGLIDRPTGVGGVGATALQDSGAAGAGSYAAAIAKGPNEPSFTDKGDEFALAPNDITIEFWYRSLPSGDPQPEQYSMMCQQIGSYTNEPNGPAIGLADGQIRVFSGAPGHGTGIWYTGRYPVDEDWHHIVVTYDEDYGGDPCSMHIQLYYDNSLVQTTINDPAVGLRNELSHMVFGAANDRGYSYSLVPGYYDEIAIYEGILDASRVDAHYYAWLPHNCAELKEKGGTYTPAWDSADINDDCIVNLYDFATFALDWMSCNDPVGGANCSPNWQ